jgi:hypothetical protein
MKATNQPALEELPEAVNALSVALAANPFFVGVYDYLMFKTALLEVGVQVALIRHHLGFGGKNGIDLLSNCPPMS